MRIARALSRNFLICCLIWSSPSFALSNITIMADDSVSLAITRLAREYARLNGVAVATSFISKEVQDKQINEGAEANVLITPDKEWLDRLQESGLIDVYSRVEIATTRMAIVSGMGSTLTMDISPRNETAPLINAMAFEQLFLLPSPDTIYYSRFARSALREADWMDALEPYTLYLKEQQQIDNLVLKDNAYTIRPQSEILMKPNMRIVGLFPESVDAPMRYYAAVIAGEDMNTARDFLSYLGSKTARHIMNNAGLTASAPTAQK